VTLTYRSVFAASLALMLAACGSGAVPNQTGSAPGGLSPGFMSVKFDVAAPFDFSRYRYFVAFNTSGNGQTPEVHPQQSNWTGFSYALEVGGAGESASAAAWEYVRSSACPTCIPSFVALPTAPSQLQYEPNSNGKNTEFAVLFQTAIFKGSATSAPWLLNAFTARSSENAPTEFLDSLGGKNSSYVSPGFDIGTRFDRTVYALKSGFRIDPAADIVSIEIANNP
jgi:hypothetical protein